MAEWAEGSFEITLPDGSRTVTGLVSGAFGIHHDAERDPPGWVVTHIGTGHAVGSWQPFSNAETAKAFVARIEPLAEWNDVDADDPPDVALEVQEIAEQLQSGRRPHDYDPRTRGMGQVPPYMGDVAFRPFLEASDCPTTLEAIRLRFLGAAVSSAHDLELIGIVEDLFEGQLPEFRDEAHLKRFVEAFFGLWNEIARDRETVPIKLSAVGSVASKEQLKDVLYRRVDEIVFGFLDGIWSGDGDLPVSLDVGDTLMFIERAGGLYDEWLQDVFDKEATAIERDLPKWLEQIARQDRLVEDAMAKVVTGLLTEAASDALVHVGLDERIEELVDAEELPEEAIRHCLDHPDEAVPSFLRLLQHYAENPYLKDSRAGALFFIIHILGELGEKRAFAPLIDFLSGDQHRVDEILGDAVGENLVQILINVFDGQTDLLYQVMNDPEVNEFARYSTFMAWTYVVASGQIERDEAEQYLSGCPTTLRPQDESYVWVAWLDCIANLGFEHLKPLVRQAFDVGRVPAQVVGWQDFEEALEGRLAASDPMEFLRSKRIHPFADTIGTLSGWCAFSEEYLGSRHQAHQSLGAAVTASNPYRNVGRNDPCPCGSGKKFKKCCLN
jgi:hypothetical protein